MIAAAATGVVERALTEFLADLEAAIPRLVSGIVFLILAGGLVVLALRLLNGLLARVLSGDSPVYRSFVVTVAGVVLWFGVLLSFLSVVGLGGIAVALGTASGFLALGVSYAVSEMIADAVAGIYLLRDPDFMPGDRVTVGDTTGVVTAIELRKTRLDVDGDTQVRGNADIEKRWTKLDDPDGAAEADGDEAERAADEPIDGDGADRAA